MKKIMWAVMAAVLLIASNLFAADGDLIVEGNVGIGTAAPTARLDVDSTDSIAGDFTLTRSANQNNRSVLVKYTDNVSNATTGGQALWVDATHNTGASFSYWWASITGAIYSVNLKGSNWSWGTSGVTVQSNVLNFASSGDYKFVDVAANSSGIAAAGADSGLRTITNLAAYRGAIALENSSGTWNVENASIFYAPAMVPHNYGTITNTAGVVVEKQSIGTNNMGIWLKGDGAGADLVFGPSREASIYSNSGRLYAQDSSGNQTILSPHDTETGEWIYYSKNVKTGRVVRVNMEELVRDMEKLTGKKYLIESLMTDKNKSN